MQSSPKKKTIEDLNRLYNESEQINQGLFAEQRTNVLLNIGEHYNKKGSKFWSRIRDARNLTEEQKIRITRNHIQKIVKIYINNITAQAPGVLPVPKNEKELQDIKAAQLNKAVWQDAIDRHVLKAQTYLDALDFITIGEVACKIFWDPDAGKFLGYEQAVDEMGQPMLDEEGQPASSGKPVFEGDFVFERIYGFNLLQPREAKTMQDAHCLIIRKMVDLEELKRKVGDDPEKLKLVQASEDKTMLVFDGILGGYKNEKNQCMLREFYYKPGPEHPMGYFYIATQEGVLFEGELPFGVYPIIYEGFDVAQTTPRHFSPIKVAKPYQVEINRAASNIVETQITTGQDKLLLQTGTKLSQGATLPGIRAIHFTGMKPESMPGRTGDQYLPYIDSIVQEMYNVLNLEEDSKEKNKQADPFAMLFFSIKDKKKYSVYTDKFERYQISKCKLYLTLAKQYFDEARLIPAIGANERVNIAEFKATTELAYQIKLQPMVDDAETMFGKQLVMNQVIQYTGNQLGKEDIGRIIRNMPFGNADESFSDLTIDYDTATNMILALDRGEMPEIQPYDNIDYMLKRITSRMRSSDFRYLTPQIQDAYKQITMQYQQSKADQLQKLQEAEAGFIPSGGAKIKADYYVAAPNNPAKVERATLPAEAVDWLIKRLAEQGTSQESLQKQSQGVQVEVADKILAQHGQGPLPPATQPIPSPTVSTQANA